MLDLYFDHNLRIPQGFDDDVLGVAAEEVTTAHNNIDVTIGDVSFLALCVDVVAIQIRSKNKQWLQETIPCSWKWIDQTVSFYLSAVLHSSPYFEGISS